MSKNVAVFVDVANIFYAAKAAGVDIDYVTLLKSATAGRDLVRAYAYTGLDPENENQRQFHGFLARSGFKVVSKDIRKYGDGRVKANLDIELVVDLMRMAEKLDVAVVVSGDGDFAPAITAVQQQGVRVEVISFRGNTSSDLIDVADIFIDIGSVAKVEKGARSGRRVAAEGDLSMTEVPDKESGVTPRRRRRDGEERPERAIRTGRRRGSPAPATHESEAEAPAPAPETGRPMALMPLPGEKLSRGAAIPPPVAETAGEPDDVTQRSAEEPQEEGRRRRRRRGGRGRGRGGRGPEVGEAAEAPVDELEAELPDFPDEVEPLPQHAGFGSVWDSQIGVAPARRPAAAAPAREVPLDDEDLDAELEPEVPEYLLAERRAQDRRRGGRGGRSGGYRSAIDRERYGAGTRPGFQRGPARPSRSVRPSGPARPSAHSMEPIEQTPGGDPWSEVPPDVQELLRAELARRGGGGAPSGGARAGAPQRTRDAAPPRTPTAAEGPGAGAAEASPAVADEASTPAVKAPAKRTTRRKTPTAAEGPASGAAEASPAVADEASTPAVKAPAKRTTRRKTPTAAEGPGAGEA